MSAPVTRKWPCVFQGFPTEVDDYVEESWRATFGVKAPFGDLRNMWRRHHCRTLNPYGSESCPYARESCIEAFQKTIAMTVSATPTVPVGYFIRVAKSLAARRADEKPLARLLTKAVTTDKVRRTAKAEGSGDPGSETQGVDAGQGLRRPETGPIAIGDVLRALDLGPRQGKPHDGQESAE